MSVIAIMQVSDADRIAKTRFQGLPAKRLHQGGGDVTIPAGRETCARLVERRVAMCPTQPASWILGLAAALALLIGCGESGPPVHQVNGKVVFKGKSNMRQLAGGKVRFQSTTDAELMPVSAIEDDGSFSLGTFYKEKELRGVPAGTYKARLEPRRADDEGAPRPAINSKYLDFATSGLTFTVPTSGELVIEVER
jgi:hypothetical protein